jgi:hypothetical protein
MHRDQETGSVKTALDRPFDAFEDAAMNADLIARLGSVIAPQRAFAE